MPPSTELSAAVERLKARRESGLGVFAQRRALDEAEAKLRSALERDELQAERPEGCRCLGAGTILSEGRWCTCPEGIAAEAESERRAAVARARDVAAFIDRAAIPQRNRMHTLESHPQPPAELLAWTGEGGRGLYISGPTGRGKTGLAAGVLRRWVEANCQSALFVVVPDLLDAMRNAYRRDEDAPEGELIKRVKDVPLLVLDDLGTEKPSDWVEEKLYLIVNHRYGAMRPTIFTSNLALKELGMKWHERIAWRIAESCDVVHLKGPNLRAKGANG